MLYYFRSLIDFNWIEGHLISDWVGSSQVEFGSDRISLTFKKNQIGSGSNPDESDRFLGSDRVLPPLPYRDTN
jgi:hypothetical protein